MEDVILGCRKFLERSGLITFTLIQYYWRDEIQCYKNEEQVWTWNTEGGRFIEYFSLNIWSEERNWTGQAETEGNYYMFNPYPTAFPYGNGMVLHFYQQQESSTTKTVHKVINKGLKTYV